jgi:hypothetical protein
MFEDFETIELPDVIDRPSIRGLLPGLTDGFVYIVSWVRDGQQVPFYVGETRRLPERMNDYSRAAFSACADFRVGTAIRYFQNKKYGVTLRYKPSADRAREESGTIRKLHLSGVRLLNDLGAYDYTKAKETEEKEVVQGFCDSLIGPSPGISML